MLEIESRRYGFKTKTVWFSEVPYDIIGFDAVAFYACAKDVDLEGFSKRVFTTIVIDLTQDRDAIWEKMSKRTCRNPIERAEKAGVKIRVNQGYEDFFELNRTFRMTKGLPPYDLDIEFMKRYGTLFISMIDGTILGGQFSLNDSKYIRGLLSASKRLESAGEGKPPVGDANKLLIWEAVQYAKGRGIETYDMGGYYTGERPDPQKDGIKFFKKSFGGDIVTQYIYEKDYSKMYTYAKKGYNFILGIRPE